MRSPAFVFCLFFLSVGVIQSMPDENEWIISSDGARLVTDGVMGGVSRGDLLSAEHAGRACLRLVGDVSTDNNGGFVQLSVTLDAASADVVTDYDGIRLDVSGNGETYNVHLRTADLRLPWQSYRASFVAGPQWRRIELPFTAFAPHRVDVPLRVGAIERIGVVVIGRDFEADICVARMAFYRDDPVKASD